jgi:hypothetical protein
MSALWIESSKSTTAMDALFAHQNFGPTAVCFSLRHATLLACFPIDSTNS